MTETAPRWRHVKRGSVYTLVGEAYAQSAEPIAEGETVQVYKGTDGRLHVRRHSEFHDGRFVLIPDGEP